LHNVMRSAKRVSAGIAYSTTSSGACQQLCKRWILCQMSLLAHQLFHIRSQPEKGVGADRIEVNAGLGEDFGKGVLD
jgi:hypothetical protein